MDPSECQVSQRASATPAAIRVRQAGVEDAALLAELGELAFAHAFGPDNTAENLDAYLRQSFGVQIQAAELADPDTQFLVAETGGEAVGFARLREGEAPPAITGAHPIEIGRFYARPDWIGRGVGAALMHACLEHTRQRGKDCVWLDVWERNQQGRAFYLRWGFREVGTQLFLLGEDIQTDILMERPILPEGPGE
jgi:ribosomal protein S18 acetylase RimI-like enzyme